MTGVQTCALPILSEHVTGLTLTYGSTTAQLEGNSIQATPSSTTTYTLRGTGVNGEEMESSVTVTVNPKVTTGTENNEEEETVVDDTDDETTYEQGNNDNDDNYTDKSVEKERKGLFEKLLDTINDILNSERSTQIALSATVSILSISSFLQLFTDTSYWGLVLSSFPIVKKKKKQSFAFVYDSITKAPIVRAIVRVTNGSGLLVSTGVTDVFGMFEVELEEGEYQFSVQASGYTFPSSIVVGGIDDPYINIYTGGLFRFNDSNVLNISIPMDPVNTDLLSSSSAKVKNILSNLLNIVQYLLIIVSVILLVMSLSRGISPVNLTILVIYLIVVIVKIVLWIKGRKEFGTLYDQNGQPLSNITIGLRDSDFGRIAAKRVTDDKGRYRFVVPGGKYSLEMLESGFTLSPKDIEVLEGKEDRVMVVNKDLVVSSR